MSKTDESPTRGFQIYLCDKDGKVKSAARFVAIVMGGKGTLILSVVEFRYLCNAITKYQKSATGDLRTRRFRLYDCDRDSKENSTARNMVHFVAIVMKGKGTVILSSAELRYLCNAIVQFQTPGPRAEPYTVSGGALESSRRRH